MAVEKKRECCGDQLRNIPKEAGRSALSTNRLAWRGASWRETSANDSRCFISFSLLPFLLPSHLLVCLSPTFQSAFLEGTQSICIHEGDHRIDAWPVSRTRFVSLTRIYEKFLF